MTKYSRRKQEGGNPPPREIFAKNTRTPISGSILPNEKCPSDFTTIQDKCYICVSPGVFNPTTKQCDMPCPKEYRDDGAKCYAPCPIATADNHTDTCEPGYAKQIVPKVLRDPEYRPMAAGGVTCPVGYTKVNNVDSCYKCEQNYTFDPTTQKCMTPCQGWLDDIGKQCRTRGCLTGYIEKDFMCSCPAGFEQKNNKCLCPDGFEIKDNKCVAIQTSSAPTVASPVMSTASPPTIQYSRPAWTTPAGIINFNRASTSPPLSSFYVMEPSDYTGQASTAGQEMSLAAASNQCISKNCYGFVFETPTTETRSISQIYSNPTDVRGIAKFKRYSALEGRAVNGPLPASGPITKRFFEKVASISRLDSSQTQKSTSGSISYTWPLPPESIASAGSVPASGGGRKRTLRKKYKSGKKTSKAKRRK